MSQRRTDDFLALDLLLASQCSERPKVTREVYLKDHLHYKYVASMSIS